MMGRHEIYLMLKNCGRWMSQKEIKERSGYGMTTISRHLNRLKNEKLIIDKLTILSTIVTHGLKKGYCNIAKSKMWRCIECDFLEN